MKSTATSIICNGARLIDIQINPNTSALHLEHTNFAPFGKMIDYLDEFTWTEIDVQMVTFCPPIDDINKLITKLTTVCKLKGWTVNYQINHSPFFDFTLNDEQIKTCCLEAEFTDVSKVSYIKISR